MSVAVLDKLTAELAELDKSENEFLDKIEKHRAVNGIAYFRPYVWQKKFIETVREKLITLAPNPNKTGKSTMSVNIVGSWAKGYEPWNRVLERDAKENLHIEVEGRFYRKSSLGIEPPVCIRISGEDWEENMKRTVVPALKKWLPVGEYKTKKNNQGVDCHFEWNNGSEFILMTHGQDDDSWESSNNHGWWADEPPPKEKYDAMSRGMFLSKGKVIMPITPLKEPWILDDLVLSGRRDIGIIDGLSILDNDDLRVHDKELLRRIWLASRNN